MATQRGRTIGFADFLACGALAAATMLGPGGCHRGATGTNGTVLPDGAEAPPAVPFQVRRDSTDLTFFWFDAHGTAHAVARVDDVPEANRETVRVDPSQPDQRAAGWVYVADLRAPGAEGRFVVHAEPIEQFASDLARLAGNPVAAAEPTTPPPGTAPNVPSVLRPAMPSGAAGAHAARIVIYGASWCGACHQAAAYLRSNNIPFVEHDIEREPQAAAELADHARQQGVPLGSIPIIDVNGRLMVGFNADALQQAIRGT